MPPNSKPDFYDDLVYYLKATKVHENIIKKLGSFDFSKTARYAFVHTMSVALLTLHRSLALTISSVEEPIVIQRGSVLDTPDLVVQ